ARDIDLTQYLTNLPRVGSIVWGTGGARTFVNADNVISPGTFDLGFESLLHIDGSSVNLSRGNFNMQTAGLGITTIGAPFVIAGNITNFTSPFLFLNSPDQTWDAYWGFGADIVNPEVQFGTIQSSQP